MKALKGALRRVREQTNPLMLLVVGSLGYSAYHAEGWSRWLVVGVIVFFFAYPLLPDRRPSRRRSYAEAAVMAVVYLAGLAYAVYYLLAGDLDGFALAAFVVLSLFYVYVGYLLVQAIVGSVRLARTGVYERIAARERS